MSDLQIALGAIGILVVGCVYAFNWWQERRLRQRLERAFAGSRDDVLLKTAAEKSSEPASRIEPRLSVDGSDTAAISNQNDVVTESGADALIDFIVELRAPESFSAASLKELRSAIAVFGKPARMLVWDTAAEGWRAADEGGVPDICNRLLVTLQLVSRSGPIHAPQLNGFLDAVRSWAAKNDATVETDDTTTALQTAKELDALCGELDVAIGLNVVAPEGSTFSGEQVAAAADAIGFELEADGLFYWQGSEGHALFTMENHDSAPFAADRLATLQTPGMTLLLDVPRVADGEAALDEMARVGSELADVLGGFVVDDNRVPLQAEGIARIKAQLRSIRETMAAREIPAGSPRAKRLFA